MDVIVGDTLMVELVSPPGDHVYVVALLPVSVVDEPEHIVAGPATAVSIGFAVTVTTTV